MTDSSSTATPVRPRDFKQPWAWWFMVAVLALVAAVRLRLLDFSLERDEGEYAYAGQLLLQGIPPYQLAFNMKFPGAYAMYALIMAAFGETPAGIHFGVLIVTTLTALMLYWLGKRMLDATAGAVAASSYAVLAANTALFGLAGHATHFAAIFATAGLCLMWEVWRRRRWRTVAAAGFMFGLATLMMQQTAILAAWAFGFYVWESLFKIKDHGIRPRWRSPLAFGIGAALPVGLCFLWLWNAGVFRQFWFWTVDYARQYVSMVPVSAIGSQLWWSLRSMASEDFLLWLPCLAGLGTSWFDARLRPMRWWLLGFGLASFLTTFPGFYFRTHYFLLALPALALLAGCAVSGAGQCWRQRVTTKFSQWPAGVYALLLAVTVVKTSDAWFVFAKQGAHALYGPELFPEAETVSKFIHDNSKPDAQIAVLGSEPEIYFLAQRHSATGYIYTYPLMEPQPFATLMQREMIREIETNAPEFVVFVNRDFSWHQTPQSDVTIFRWWDNYKTNYSTVGLVEQNWPYPSQFFWGKAAAAHGKLKGAGMEVFWRPKPPPLLPLSGTNAAP